MDASPARIKLLFYHVYFTLWGYSIRKDGKYRKNVHVRILTCDKSALSLFIRFIDLNCALFFVEQEDFLIKKVLSCGMKTHFNIDKLGFGEEKEEFIVVVFWQNEILQFTMFENEENSGRWDLGFEVFFISFWRYLMTVLNEVGAVWGENRVFGKRWWKLWLDDSRLKLFLTSFWIYLFANLVIFSYQSLS